MSIFGSILAKIFHHPAAATEQAPPVATDTTVPQPVAAAVAPAPAAAAPDAAPPAAAPAAASVDVGAVLADMASKSSQPLNYKTSIVDLMKLLGLDSSLDARKTLAGELHYTGDTNDSATMNVWLHKEVVQKLAENGGKVPADMQAA